MKYYDDLHDLIIEEGSAVPRKAEDVSGLSLWSTSPEFIEQSKIAQVEGKENQIRELEQRLIRNVIALAEIESKKERDYFNERLAKIKELRAEINGIIEEAAPNVSLWNKLKSLIGL
jgi:hypothetical protein